jgi:hypothetical protein
MCAAATVIGGRMLAAKNFKEKTVNMYGWYSSCSDYIQSFSNVVLLPTLE